MSRQSQLGLRYLCTVWLYFPYLCDRRIPISSHMLHRVVRQYLLHYGYGDTLRAFELEAGWGDEEVAAGRQGGGGGEGKETAHVVNEARGSAMEDAVMSEEGTTVAAAIGEPSR